MSGGGGSSQLGILATSASLGGLVALVRRLGYRVSALWCPDAGLAIQTAAEAEIPFVAGKPDDVLLRKEVEMLLIAAEPALHAQLCDKALGIGKHVICLPPATLALSEATKILEAARYYPQITSIVAFRQRHLPVFQRLKQELAAGTIGKPLLVRLDAKGPPQLSAEFDWRWESAMGGGVLNLIGTHLIDLLSFLLGLRASSVQSTSITHSPFPSDGFRRLAAENFAAFFLHFPSGSVAAVSIDCLSEAKEHSQVLVVTGSSGSAIVEGGRLVVERRGEKARELVAATREEGELDTGFSSLLAAVKKGGASPELQAAASFEDAFYARATVEAIRYSAATATSAPIPTPPTFS